MDGFIKFCGFLGIGGILGAIAGGLLGAIAGGEGWIVGALFGAPMGMLLRRLLFGVSPAAVARNEATYVEILQKKIRRGKITEEVAAKDLAEWQKVAYGKCVGLLNKPKIQNDTIVDSSSGYRSEMTREIVENSVYEDEEKALRTQSESASENENQWQQEDVERFFKEVESAVSNNISCLDDAQNNLYEMKPEHNMPLKIAPKLVMPDGPKPSKESLLKSGWSLLEASEWEQADMYFDYVLNIDPEFAPAYFGKLCAERRANNEASLLNTVIPLDNSPNYMKLIRFSCEKYRTMIEGYNKAIRMRYMQVSRVT